MGRSRAWGVLPASGFGHIALSCLLTGSVACGDYTSNSNGGGTQGSSTESGTSSSAGSTGGVAGSSVGSSASSSGTGGSSNGTGGSSNGTGGSSSGTGGSSSAYCGDSAGSSGSAGESASGSSAAGSITGGTQPDDACDCESRDCRPAPEVANDLCCSGNLVTYIEREGCDYVELSYDYNRGWRGYYYEKEGGELVAFRLDNAFGGNLHCGEETSCTGDIIQHCVVCRASWPLDIMPDCPTTLWERSGGER